MVGAAGFEPATSCTQSRHPTWLSYAPFLGHLTLRISARQQFCPIKEGWDNGSISLGKLKISGQNRNRSGQIMLRFFFRNWRKSVRIGFSARSNRTASLKLSGVPGKKLGMFGFRLRKTLATELGVT